MAPQKTMVISQQQSQQGEQQAAGAAVKQQQGKPRKRKAKQPQQQTTTQANDHHTNQNDRIVEQVPSLQVSTVKKLSDATNGKENLVAVAVKESASKMNNTNNTATTTNAPIKPVVVPSERASIKKQQQSKEQSQQVPSKESVQSESKRAVPAIAVVTTTTSQVIGKHQQLISEDADDIDAGIELDGSSNSGSSIKDINEDQMKSTSVSPVMAQSNLVNEPCLAQSVSEVEKLAAAKACLDSSLAKKISTTKQQLAANQQVIDADEQLLQEKLQNKQRKSQTDTVNTTSTTTTTLTGAKGSGISTPSLGAFNHKLIDGDKTAKSAVKEEKTTAKAAPPLRRRFSSQSSQEAQDGSLCKVCELHVYQMERLMAEKSIYHKKCFRCHQCKIQLRVDNYSSHEGLVYCKAHHRQIFQPQVKLDSEDDVDIVAKSKPQTVDDYLLHRGRLSELSFSFLQQTPEGIQKRQMIICENEPAELPKDVVRSDTKLDDGIEQLNLNLNNILEKFERGTASNGEESQPSSAGVVIEKPSFNIKQTLAAFENKFGGNESSESQRPERVSTERPVVKKLTNLNGFFNRQNSIDVDGSTPVSARNPVPVTRSGSLMMRLKKYESRIAGEQVEEDESSDDDENNNDRSPNKNGDEITSERTEDGASSISNKRLKGKRVSSPKKLTSIDLSSLKNQWENGDISKRGFNNDEDDDTAAVGEDNNCNGISSLSSEKDEELSRIRQQLAQRKSGEARSVRNIYENAIRESQLQKEASRRDSSDLSALNGFSTTGIQKQLLQTSLYGNGSIDSQNNTKTPTTPNNNINKDHYQLNFSNKANKLKERFELGLITNSSHDDSDCSESDETPALSKLDQIRQEKLEDLSVFTEGEIKAREARSLFQQIDRRISGASHKNRQVTRTSN